MAKQVKYQKGDKVAFARAFLRNTGQVTGWAPFARGTVLSTAPMGGHDVVRVQWQGDVRRNEDGSPYISGVLDCNLVRADRLHLEAV